LLRNPASLQPQHCIQDQTTTPSDFGFPFFFCFFLKNLQIRDGNIVQQNVEMRSSLDETNLNHFGHQLSLHNELRRVELSNHTFQNLIHNRRENAIIKILHNQISTKTKKNSPRHILAQTNLPQCAIDFRQKLDVGTRQNTAA
jgi:hypothetical protein